MSSLTIAQAFQLAGQQFAAGRTVEAESLCQRILAAEPHHADSLNLLGLIAHQAGHLDAAAAWFTRATEARPDFPPFHSNLSVVLNAREEFDAAERAAESAVALAPDYLEAWFNLGIIRGGQEKLDGAAAAYRRAIALKPDFVPAWTNLGNILKRQGRLDGALAAYRQGVALDPRNAEAHGVLVQNLLYHPSYDSAAIAREEALWDARHGQPIQHFAGAHMVVVNPERRLKIGYVSPDLRDHVVGLNVLPLFEAHDREQFEILCYSAVTRPDAITDRFRAVASEWRDTTGVPDDALAATIRADEVDILVDLALHTAGNRLGVFTRKPAPIQVSFAGYPGATGLSAIDYRISDRHLEAVTDEAPAGVLLIESFWCYAALATPLEVGALPALEHGRFTFGCLNHCWKVNERVLRLWARVLRGVGDSSLVLQSPLGSHRADTLAILAHESIPAERVEFVERRPRDEYLATYRRLDLALDTFPYNGHTTSLDALWMGVPVITLAGETIVSRAGLSQAMNLGLPEMVAHSEEDFVRIAIDLAHDLPRLGDLRASLREKMRRSVLMDASRFARGIEGAYRAAWRRWCGRQSSDE